MIDGNEAIETLKQNEQVIADYYDANKERVQEIHKAMSDAAEALGATNIDMLLHVAFILDGLHKNKGAGRIEYAKSVGLLALRAGLPVLAMAAQKETTH